MSRFAYLLEKIRSSSFETVPFRHVYIEDFFSPEDFAEITASPEIALPPSRDDEDLFDNLYAHGYKMVQFPGCITSRTDYIEWHNQRKTDRKIHSACEGFGVTLRLAEPRTPVIEELRTFLSGEQFNKVLAEKFGIGLERCNVDGGIQKYLDGYEISPHPDIRRKAATFMVNMNPHQNSEELQHHTYYLRFKPKYQRVQREWETNQAIDRCWVPWDWCETVKTQPKNNSIVLFSPGNDTMHAVRARYDHLPAQRTQLYGNLWYNEMPELLPREWEDLGADLTWTGIRHKAVDALPAPIGEVLRSARQKLKRAKEEREDTADVAERHY